MLLKCYQDKGSHAGDYNMSRTLARQSSSFHQIFVMTSHEPARQCSA